MYLHRLYIGCGGQSEEAIEALEAYATGLGDHTVCRAEGSWKGERELSLVYDHMSYQENLPWFMSLLAERAKTDLNQEAVLYMRWPVTSEIL